MVVNEISATVLGLVGGGPGEGDAVTATITRGATPFCLCDERSGHLKAPQPCETGGSTVVAAARGSRVAIQSKEVQKRRAPESARSDVRLRRSAAPANESLEASSLRPRLRICSTAAHSKLWRQQWRAL